MESNGDMEIRLKIRLSKNKIICDVIQARNLLPPKNNDRLWSPCVKIEVIKTASEKDQYNRPFILSPRTKNIKNSINPTWNEQLQIIFTPKTHHKLSLLIQCWDSDTFAEDDLIGYNLLTIASLIDSPKEDWWPLLPNPNFTDESKDENSNRIDSNSVTCLDNPEFLHERSDQDIDNGNNRSHFLRRSSSLIVLGNRAETSIHHITMFDILTNHNGEARLSIKEHEDLNSLERLQEDTHESETKDGEFNPNKSSKGNIFKRHRRHSFDCQTINAKATEKVRKRDYIKSITKKFSMYHINKFDFIIDFSY